MTTISLAQAAIRIMQQRGVNVENVIDDQFGLYGLLRYHGNETAAACVAAMDTLRGLLPTGMPAGEATRRAVTAREVQDRFINVLASSLTYPSGGCASKFPPIAGLLVLEEAVRKHCRASKNANAPKKVGAPTVVDWSVVETETIRLMEYHSDFDPGDLEWNRQARLEKKLLAFCSKKFRKEPGVSTLRGHIRGWLKQFRTASTYPPRN